MDNAMTLDNATALVTVHRTYAALLEATARGWAPTLQTELRPTLAHRSAETYGMREASRMVADALEADGRRVFRREVA